MFSINSFATRFTGFPLPDRPTGGTSGGFFDDETPTLNRAGKALVTREVDPEATVAEAMIVPAIRFDTDIAEARGFTVTLNAERNILSLSGIPVLKIEIRGGQVLLSHSNHPHDNVDIRVTDFTRPDSMGGLLSDYDKIEPTLPKGETIIIHQNELVYVTINHQVFAFRTNTRGAFEGTLGLVQLTNAGVEEHIIEATADSLHRDVRRVIFFDKVSIDENAPTVLGNQPVLRERGAFFEGPGVQTYHLGFWRTHLDVFVRNLAGVSDQTWTWVTDKDGHYFSLSPQATTVLYPYGHIRAGSTHLSANAGRLASETDRTNPNLVELNDTGTTIFVRNFPHEVPYVQLRPYDASNPCAALIMLTPNDTVKVWIQSGMQETETVSAFYRINSGDVIHVSPSGDRQRVTSYMVLPHDGSDWLNPLPFRLVLLEPEELTLDTSPVLAGDQTFADATLKTGTTVDTLEKGAKLVVPDDVPLRYVRRGTAPLRPPAPPAPPAAFNPQPPKRAGADIRARYMVPTVTPTTPQALIATALLELPPVSRWQRVTNWSRYNTDNPTSTIGRVTRALKWTVRVANWFISQIK